MSGIKSVSKTKKKAKKKSAKRKKKKPAKRMSGALSEAHAQRLGFTCDDLAAADAELKGAYNLAKYFVHHPRIAKAFERGQFLRNLKGLAAVVMTVSEAAHKLGLGSGEELRQILDSDPESADIWSQTRLDTILAAREALLAAAKEGNQTAIRAVENYLREEKQAATAGLSMDLMHLSQKQLYELVGTTKVTLLEWEKKHGLPRNSDKTYDLRVFLDWYGKFCQRKGAVKIEPADKLRDLKAAKMQVELAERKGQLLPREDVVAGLVARVQAMVSAFSYKRRELASMCHGQTVEGIEDILGRFFEELQRKQLELPEVLELPEAAEAKLLECMEILGAA
jgi:hypothetical protein